MVRGRERGQLQSTGVHANHLGQVQPLLWSDLLPELLVSSKWAGSALIFLIQFLQRRWACFFFFFSPSNSLKSDRKRKLNKSSTWSTKWMLSLWRIKNGSAWCDLFLEVVSHNCSLEKGKQLFCISLKGKAGVAEWLTPGRSRQLSLFVGSVQQQKGHEGGREGEVFIPRSVPALVVSLWAAVEGVPGLSAAGSD